MNCSSAIAAVIVLTTASDPLTAQSPTRVDPLGTWRGTSLCQVRPSSCNDEHVVYRVTRVGTRDSLAIDGRKIVNGAEEEMGVLGCRLNAPAAEITCVMPSGSWRFMVHGDSLTGDLRAPNGTKLRDIRTVRSH